jgi:hypothetical protein
MMSTLKLYANKSTAEVLNEERSPENNLNTKSSTFNDNFFDKTYGKDYHRYIQIRNLWEAKNRFC